MKDLNREFRRQNSCEVHREGPREGMLVSHAPQCYGKPFSNTVGTGTSAREPPAGSVSRIASDLSAEAQGWSGRTSDWQNVIVERPERSDAVSALVICFC